MKELNYCSECDQLLDEDEKDHNREAGIENEEWICWDCEKESDPE